MKPLIDSINEAAVENVNVVCVKDLETKHHKFKKGDTDEAIRINQNWWLIDSIGIGEKQFKTYFKKNPTTKIMKSLVEHLKVNSKTKINNKEWSIKTAEDGDIINWNHTELYFMYKCLNGELKQRVLTDDNVIIYHAAYNFRTKDLDIGPSPGVGDTTKPELFQLADIEKQKEFLQVLTNNGYEWNENKKELIKK